MKKKYFQIAKNMIMYAKIGGTKGDSKSKNPCTSAIPDGYFKIKAIQEKFQKPDCKPIFLKGGVIDQILYRLTWGMCFVGIAGSLMTFIELL